MRKQSLKMEKMRPQLEKLQKQYANDQNTYNAKMMEMYKKNGYSMLGACLPMIVTLVIFMIVLGAFSVLFFALVPATGWVERFLVETSRKRGLK